MRIISTYVDNTKKVRSREDDNYSNWVIINYGVYKGLYHISCLLQIIKPFIRPPQVIFFFFYLKSSKTHTSAAPLLLEKGAEVKMKLQDLKLLIDKKKKKH